jgi:acylphosphatase
VVVVTGKVQGVAFRHHTALEAKQQNLEGWVRNNRDGTVQVEAQGEEKSLQKFILYLRAGPVHAKVIELDTKWLDATESSGKFIIKY